MEDYIFNKYFIRNPVKLIYFILLPFLMWQSCQVPGPGEPFNPVRYAHEQNSSRNRPFDNDWKFYRGDIPGAENPSFDDSKWRLLDLPHDWSIEDLPATADTFPAVDPPMTGPFTPASPGNISTGFVLGGTGWYRKAFILHEKDIGNNIQVRFDGVYMNADLWINGFHLGNHPYGYTSFFYDITPFLNPAGETNILAVQVKNNGRNSRWYSGSGIYRHVWLDVRNPVHIGTWGVHIMTTQVSDTGAVIKISTSIKNTLDTISNLTVKTRLISPDGEPGEYFNNHTTLFPNEEGLYGQTIIISKPELWSLDKPSLYLAEVTVLLENKEVDRHVTPFGIRDIHFDAGNGFQLNGKNVLLRGGNMHHDNGPLGSATIDRAEYRRVEIMKANGYNAIRTSHNPPSSQFLDACDQLGMLVLDEAFDMWQRPKKPQDYHLYFDDWWQKDLSSMVLRDRNHPCVIMWSIGNEVNERADSSGLKLAKKMYDLIKTIDDTRPVTEAICGFWDHPGREWGDTAPAFKILDVGGYNYQWRQYEPDHDLFPQRIVAGTESIVLEAWENWNQVKNHSFVIGDFLWTGMDYLGEASIGHAVQVKKGETFNKGWPWFNAWCGDIDLCGNKKPQSYYRDVVWGRSKIEMMVHAPVPEGYIEEVSYWGWPDEWKNWNWKVGRGKAMQVSVYSSYPEVLLELNGKEVGRKDISPEDKMTAHFEVTYVPGQIKAIGLEHGKRGDSTAIETTGRPVAIRMEPDRNSIHTDRNDLCYVSVELVDDQGRRVPDADNRLDFEVSGEGELAAVGNGNPTDIKSFQNPHVKSFRGRCLVILRPLGLKGSINLNARAAGLAGSGLEIKVK